MKKLLRFSIFIFITIAAYVFNHYYLLIKPFPFTGVYLGAWLFVGFIGLYLGKIYKKKRGLPQEPNAYALPDVLAKVMKKVDMRTQYESSILSMFFIMVGLIAFTIYLIFLSEFTIMFKVLTGFNTIFGLMFMLSYLITTYQQYISYMETQNVMMDIIKNSPGGNAEIMPSFPGLPQPQLDIQENIAPNKNDERRLN